MRNAIFKRHSGRIRSVQVRSRDRIQFGMSSRGCCGKTVEREGQVSGQGYRFANIFIRSECTWYRLFSVLKTQYLYAEQLLVVKNNLTDITFITGITENNVSNGSAQFFFFCKVTLFHSKKLKIRSLRNGLIDRRILNNQTTFARNLQHCWYFRFTLYVILFLFSYENSVEKSWFEELFNNITVLPTWSQF